MLLYADDIFLLYDFFKHQQPTSAINHDLIVVNSFLNQFGLRCNLSKSNILSFGAVRSLDKIKTSLGYIAISRSLTILGFELHMHLNAKYHVQRLEKNFDEIVNILSLQKNNLRFLSESLKRILYSSMFRSRIVCYAGALRLVCTPSDYKRLDRALARSIKLIYCLIKSTIHVGALAICSAYDTRTSIGRLINKWRVINNEYLQLFQHYDTLHSYNNIDQSTRRMYQLSKPAVPFVLSRISTLRTIISVG